MRHPSRICLSLLALPFLSAASGAQTPLVAERLVSGLANPIWAGAPPGDDRLFIALQSGVIKGLENGAIRSINYLGIKSKVLSGGEQGLLGVAFHPNYAANGFVYVNYTNTTGATVVSRFKVGANSPGRLNHNSEKILLTQAQPFTNHNAGNLAFGPDGYLYVAFGDGGSGNDPSCNAQKLDTWLGKILRLDVGSGLPYAIPSDNPFVGVGGALPEIYHLGLRNPWRLSFDAATGDMLIGDVGQDAREEINFAPAGASGLNFGWKVLEGTKCNQSGSCEVGTPGCASPDYVAPIYELVHQQVGGPGSITGGFVYRGCAIPDLVGTYFFADYVDNGIRSFVYDPLTQLVEDFQDRSAELDPPGGPSVLSIASFGEDGFGEVLLVKHHPSNGEVFKIVPANGPASGNAVLNGSGSNPVCLVADSLPVINNRWRATVDVSGHPGATMAALIAHQGSSSGSFLSGGEVLVDLGSPKFFSILRPVVGSEVPFSVVVPCDVSLAGGTFSTQGVVLGGAGWALCNAVEVTVGYF